MKTLNIGVIGMDPRNIKFVGGCTM